MYLQIRNETQAHAFYTDAAAILFVYGVIQIRTHTHTHAHVYHMHTQLRKHAYQRDAAAIIPRLYTLLR